MATGMPTMPELIRRGDDRISAFGRVTRAGSSSDWQRLLEECAISGNRRHSRYGSSNEGPSSLVTQVVRAIDVQENPFRSGVAATKAGPMVSCTIVGGAEAQLASRIAITAGEDCVGTRADQRLGSAELLIAAL